MRILIYIRYIILFLTSCVFLVSCASTGSPNGGPKDTRAPKLVVEESSPNYSVNYSPQKIEMVFDEWIELKNQSQEILISPPFFKKPKISSRGKKVTVQFPEDEPLRPDATYTLNFGKSIVDFTEANPVDGFRFLFSTGDKIDSLTFSGIVVDAYGGEPVKDILVMLYDIVEDSIVVKEKPFYYARSGDDGSFKFENLKNDTFKLLVLEDLNLNYLLDPELERLAFSDSLFVLNDSSSFSPKLRLFKPAQSTRILSSSSKTQGLITSVFNKEADEIDFQYLYPSVFNPIVETRKDTMRFWFAESIDSAGIVYGSDTLDFNIKAFDTTFYKKKVVLRDMPKKMVLAPFDSLKLSFSAPLMAVDTSFISLSDQPKPKKSTSVDRTESAIDISRLSPEEILELRKDTIAIDTIPSALIDSTGIGILDTAQLEEDTIMFYDFRYTNEIREAIIDATWKEGHKYQMTLLPGAITDIYGRQNDTIIYNFETNSLDAFGNILLTVGGLDTMSQYIVILRAGDEVIGQSTINNRKKELVNFNRLPVNTYNIHLIKDENRDEKWTPGDYWEKQQPELLKKFELEKLRENWDLEAAISWEAVDTLGGSRIDALLDSISTGIDTSQIKRGGGIIEKQKPIEKGIREGGNNPPKGKGIKQE